MDAWHWMLHGLPFEWLQPHFMQHALLAVLLIGPLFALLGCIVVNHQMAFFSDAMGHSALAGVAIGALLGLPDPTLSVTAFAVLLALLVLALKRSSAVSTDTVIALVMAFVVALGVVLLSRGGGFRKYTGYLIGDLLTVTPAEVGRLALLLVVVLAACLTAFNAMFMVGLNRSVARSRGVAVGLTDALFSVLVAVVVAVSIPWVGLLVINSLLVLPAATARNVARGTRSYVLGAIAVSLLSGVLGLICSYYWDTATGATIVLWAAGLFAVSLVARRLRGPARSA
jgi:zinc transport system permease protein